MLRKIFTWPARNLLIVIPSILLIGFIVGLNYNTSFLKAYILYGTVAMVYPSMVGFNFGKVLQLTGSDRRILGLALGVNFIFVPISAYILGITFLSGNPELLAGLVIMALIPTSGMTISWTMIFNGNVPAAVKASVVGLLSGSLLAPWYLKFMVGQYVPVDVLRTMRVIGTVILIPILMGAVTYWLIRRNYSQEEFNKHFKPLKPAFSVWALMFVVFSSISLKAQTILAEPQIVFRALAALLLFYLGNFFVSTILGRRFLAPQDGIALVYGTSVRHLSISMGLAVAAFGAGTALVIALAFLIQQQAAATYGNMLQRFSLLAQREPAAEVVGD